jgi:excisionase family DNA binding protein
MEQQLFTRKETSKLLSLSLGTLDKQIACGKLVVSRIGTKVVIHADDIHSFAAGLKKAA